MGAGIVGRMLEYDFGIRPYLFFSSERGTVFVIPFAASGRNYTLRIS
jgi:hypothetical protein